MKYRLVEILQCPKHPDEMLRVRNARISDVFPCSDDIRPPVCRFGCGLYGNWFDEIPNELPHEHFLDCRRCLGTEIEEGTLECPLCGWSVSIENGLVTANPGEHVTSRKADTLNLRLGKKIDASLNVKRGDLVLTFVNLPLKLNEKWSSSGIERVIVSSDIDSLVSNRAASCALGSSLVHYIKGPIDIDILRKSLYDAVIADFYSESLTDKIRASGKLIILSHKSQHNENPENFDKKSIVLGDERMDVFSRKGIIPVA